MIAQALASAACDAAKTLVKMALDEAGYSHLDVTMCWEDGGQALYHHDEKICTCNGVHITNISSIEDANPLVMWRAYFLADRVFQSGVFCCFDCYLINFHGNGPVECSHPVTWR